MTDTCANPLLLGWIKEWLDHARERNSKGFTVYKKAYESMKACPLVFQHPSEAQQLNGLGPKLCDRLTEKLKAYCEENGLPMPEGPSKGQKRPSGDNLPDGAPGQPAKKPKKKTKPYVPALRSGAYALLLGLATLDESSSQGLTKAQLIEEAQPHCDSSFTVPTDPTKYYTAWNSMKTLIQKDLVYEHGRPVRKYALTEEGWEVAKGIKKTAAGTSSSGSQTTLVSRDITSLTTDRVPRVSEPENSLHRQGSNADYLDLHEGSSGSAPRGLSLNQEADQQRPLAAGRHDSAQQGASFKEPVVLPPGSFTVELVLDSREVRTQKDRDYIANELTKKGVTPRVRALELGDAMWVAKCKEPNFLAKYGEESDEIMLDWIVERKRLDDLIGSIKDGRFHEQKFRLRRSGIKNVIYLVEDFSVNTQDPGAMKYQEMVASAIATTQVVNGYFVKKTRNLDDTIRYLARMTSLLRKTYEPDHASPSAGIGSNNISTVALIPTSTLSSSQSYLTTLTNLRASDPSSSTTYGVTFSTFSLLTSKSDVLTLRDVFLKMLMCTRGITGEKALEIQRRWPTPREFIEAFEQCQGQGVGDDDDNAVKAKKERMVSDRMMSLVGRKKVAGALSKKLAEIWGEAG